VFIGGQVVFMCEWATYWRIKGGSRPGVNVALIASLVRGPPVPFWICLGFDASGHEARNSRRDWHTVERPAWIFVKIGIPAETDDHLLARTNDLGTDVS